MKPAEFKAWRKHMDLSQHAAAQALGLSTPQVQNYERGRRVGADPRPVEIPKAVELACAALALGITSYDGPSG